MEKSGAKAYLVNTGWNGTGKRITIKDTRGIIDAILSGDILNAPTKKIPCSTSRFLQSFLELIQEEETKMAARIFYQEDCNLSLLEDRQSLLSVMAARDMHMH